jgi:hypothetical protein
VIYQFWAVFGPSFVANLIMDWACLSSDFNNFLFWCSSCHNKACICDCSALARTFAYLRFRIHRLNYENVNLNHNGQAVFFSLAALWMLGSVFISNHRNLSTLGRSSTRHIPVLFFRKSTFWV